MKNFSYILMSLIAISTIAGCARETNLFPEPTSAYKTPISWSIESANIKPGRALMSDSLLRLSCTPSIGGQSIGIWGDYTITKNSDTTIITEFNATPLVYAPKDEDSNPNSNWNYHGDARFWEQGAIYDFRACYPQELMSSLLTQVNATVLQGGPINTSAIQQDILVAATQVNTMHANLEEPVILKMEHIFAAIQFKVKAVLGYYPSTNEAVTSCWLQNQTNATDLFSPSGYLLHTGNSDSHIIWYTYESSTAPMYLWKHEGVSFNIEKTLYVRNNGMTGSEYTTNDGWLLIIPQQVKAETLNFCYTMKQTGDQVFSVKIPAITYEHGKKYTYLLEISGSNVELKISIAPWNTIDSSYDINL